MKANKKKSVPKYTIGPCGEIYNNQPALSPRTVEMMEMFALQDALKEALDNEKEQEEDIENDGERTSETSSEELYN